jgi:hypothetical protein
MSANKGTPGSRIRLIMGQTGSSYLIIMNEDNGQQTIKWHGMPNAICKQINNCILKDRIVKELDCSSATGAWYVEGVKRDGTGQHSWWGATAASLSLNSVPSRKVSLGSSYSNYYDTPEEIYVIISGSNGYCFSSNTPSGLKERLKRIRDRGKTINFVRLFDDRGYFISDSEGTEWSGTLGQHVGEELKKVGDGVHDVAVAKDGSWVVIRANRFVSSTGVSEELTRELASFYSRVRQAERERMERAAHEEAARRMREEMKEAGRRMREEMERQRLEQEAREEQERIEREAREEQERIEREAREEQERIEREAREEQERIEREIRQEQERLIKEAAERAEREAKRLVTELKEDCQEVEVLERLIKKRKQDIIVRIESLPPSQQLKFEEQTVGWKEPLPSKVECVICNDGEAVQAMVPCGHHCLCNGCAVHIMTSTPRTCPLCREVVQMTVKIYRAI